MCRLLLACVVVGLWPGTVFGQAGQIVEYYHTDMLGSVRAVTNQRGEVIARHDFMPFGEEVQPQYPMRDKRLFTGQERDSEILDYFNARYLSPPRGRFTTVDPGHVGGNIFDPQSWNAYAYARNNPLRFLDPSGTDYDVQVTGGSPFTFFGTHQEFEAFASGYSFEGGTFFGKILNSAGTPVGTYTYVEPLISRLIRPIADMAGPIVPVVEVAMGAFAVAATGATVAIPAGALVAGAGAQPFLLPMGGGMAAAMSTVQNPALQRALNDIFRWQDRIAGGLAGAVRYTQQTGRLVGGSDHLGKVANSIGRLESILRREVLSPGERQLAESVLRDLKGLRR